MACQISHEFAGRAMSGFLNFSRHKGLVGGSDTDVLQIDCTLKMLKKYCTVYFQWKHYGILNFISMKLSEKNYGWGD